MTISSGAMESSLASRPQISLARSTPSTLQVLALPLLQITARALPSRRCSCVTYKGAPLTLLVVYTAAASSQLFADDERKVVFRAVFADAAVDARRREAPGEGDRFVDFSINAIVVLLILHSQPPRGEIPALRPAQMQNAPAETDFPARAGPARAPPGHGPGLCESRPLPGSERRGDHLQAAGFLQPEYQVHVLDGLAGRALDHIVDGRNQDDGAGPFVELDRYIAVMWNI